MLCPEDRFSRAGYGLCERSEAISSPSPTARRDCFFAPLVATTNDTKTALSGHLYRLGHNRSNAEEIGVPLFQLSKFVEPCGGFFIAHGLPARDKGPDQLRDPIA